MVRAISERSRFALAMLRLLVSKETWPTRYLCELVASARLSSLPWISLSDLTRCVGSPKLHPELVACGSCSVAELAALSVVTAALNPKSVLEFGTCDGFSAWHLWANSGAKVLTIDLPRPVRPFLPQDSRIRLLEADSRKWEPPSDEKFDLCFIDAGHDYECVRNDSEKALRCLRPGGVILWHDATWRREGFGVNQYLRELRHSGKPVCLLHVSLYDHCSLAILRDGATVSEPWGQDLVTGPSTIALARTLTAPGVFLPTEPGERE